ncbi:MAG: hypothetical protein C0502_09320 [Opitutus sp.]|nr:hypothetical protein [Opitutus sp.]
MVTEKIQKLREYQRQMAKIEKELARYNAKLAALPAKHGFKSMDAFIDALRASGSGKGKTVRSAESSSRKPRVKITTETKQKVKAMVSDGKTGGQIAKALNISVPSVQNIKKELGLVKARK